MERTREWGDLAQSSLDSLQLVSLDICKRKHDGDYASGLTMGNLTEYSW